MSAELFSTIRTLSCKLHHNLILLLKYPDALIYLQYNTWHIFYVKICMMRWNDLCGVFDSFAGRCVTTWTSSKENARILNGRVFFLRYLYCSFWYVKTATCMWKAKFCPLLLESVVCWWTFNGLHMLHNISGASLSTDELILSDQSTEHWNACWIPSPV